MKKIFMSLAIILSLLVCTVTVFAEQSKQNHHCKLPDGTIDTTKTHKQCTAAKGSWVKDADAAKSDKKPDKKPDKKSDKKK